MNILVVVNNHLTNIFKYAYFLENKEKLINANFYFIIDSDIYKINRKIHKKYINKFISKFSNIKKITSIKINQNYNRILFKDLHKSFCNFKENKKNIKMNYRKINKILFCNFQEIWIGNSIIIDYLNTNTLIRRFEHGISDIIPWVENVNLFIKIKRKIEYFINKKLLLLNKHENIILHTIFSLKNIKDTGKVKQINKKFLLRSLKFLSERKKYNRNNILVYYPFDFINNKNRINENFADLFLKIINKKIKNFHNKMIYFKTRYNYKNIKKFSIILEKLCNQKIHILNPNNYLNIEYYLLYIKPRFIISPFNLGIYLFKNILNKNFNYININTEYENILINNCKDNKVIMKLVKTWKTHLGVIKKKINIKYI
jgi:hypothetical protein